MGEGLDGRRRVAASITFSTLILLVCSCVYLFREHRAVVHEFLGIGDVKSQIENDPASHLLIKNDVNVAIKLSDEAERVYIESDKLKTKEQNAVELALANEKMGEMKLKEANQLSKEARSLIHKSEVLKSKFENEEKWTVHQESLEQDAAKAYRRDVMLLAQDVNQISAIREGGGKISSKLSSEVKNLTRQMSIDSKMSTQGYQAMAQHPVDDSTGKDPSLSVPATSWSLQQQSAKKKSKAETIVSEAKARIAKLRTDESLLKRPFDVSECLEKHAEKFRFDVRKISNVDKTFKAVLKICGDNADGIL